MPIQKTRAHKSFGPDVRKLFNSNPETSSTDAENTVQEDIFPVEQASVFREGQALPAFRHLVVLTPNQYIDEVKFCRKIHTMALSRRTNILFLTLVSNPEDEMAAKRRLTTISALASDPLYRVETRVVWGRSWLRLTRQMVKSGDLLVCPAELTISVGFGRRKSLLEKITETKTVPVFSLQGIFQDESRNWIGLFKQAFFWIITLAIFAVFFLFEVEIEPTVNNWVNQVVVVILIVTEAIVLYFWNSIAG